MQIGLERVDEFDGHASSSVSPRLVRAAQEFEALMMKELLKPMTGQDALTGEVTDDGGDAGSTGALGEFASEALGQAISRNGGFGIAARIERELSRSGHPSDHRNTGENTRGNGAIRTAK
jgi:flagellar protein FlgJ